MTFQNSRILITGAAGGIGSSIAKHFAARGAKLLLTDLQAATVDALAAEIEHAGADVIAIAADVTTELDRQRLVARARDTGVDVLINVAGVNPFGLLVEQTAAEIERTFRINACAPIMLCQALIPVLARCERAHIVNVGSTFGSIGFPGFCVYSASKFAIRGFSEALRRELADTNIGVHYVAPRATRTALSTDRVRAMNAALGVGMDPPEAVAHAIERALLRSRRETYLGLPERVFAAINSIWPAVVDRSMRRQLPTIRRFATREPAPAPTPATAATDLLQTFPSRSQ